jgi:hypothetical protein
MKRNIAKGRIPVQGILLAWNSRLLNSFFILLLLFGCKTVPVKREIREVNEIASITPSNKFIKAHMKNGRAYILHSWRFDTLDNLLSGYGSLLDLNRRVIETRGNMKPGRKSTGEKFNVGIADIALIETNDPGPSIGGGLAIVSGVTAGFGVYCLMNPKACFGSCPTFYVRNGDTLVLQAEGFSASISPSLEKNDIDMLYDAVPTRDFELVVTNEALETHSIRHANLLAFEKTGNERIFATPDGSFYRCTDIMQARQCQSSGVEYLRQVLRADGDEYFSSADSVNLNSREELIVSFDSPANKQVGLLIGKRQTLMTTYLMYQGLAYMGNSVTYWLAEMERGMVKPDKTIFSLLGGIEVFSKDAEGGWKFEGALNETGPIATDFNVIPLDPRQPGEVVLKLRLNKGLWRVDYLGLATLQQKVFPMVIKPSMVDIIRGSEKDALLKLTKGNTYLVTYPGDAYRIRYDLPFNDAELFLDSKGYYLEWMREEWVKEQNFKKMARMMNNPSKYLKEASLPYKKMEPIMEKTFWNSRYVKK